MGASFPRVSGAGTAAAMAAPCRAEAGRPRFTKVITLVCTSSIESATPTIDAACGALSNPAVLARRRLAGARRGLRLKQKSRHHSRPPRQGARMTVRLIVTAGGSLAGKESSSAISSSSSARRSSASPGPGRRGFAAWGNGSMRFDTMRSSSAGSTAINLGRNLDDSLRTATSSVTRHSIGWAPRWSGACGRIAVRAVPCRLRNRTVIALRCDPLPGNATASARDGRRGTGPARRKITALLPGAGRRAVRALAFHKGRQLQLMRAGCPSAWRPRGER